jgi:hypothetical protein
LRIGDRVVLAGTPNGDAYMLSASEARRRGLKIKFVRRMGDDYPRAIEFVSSGRVNVRALVTHRESLNAAPEVFCGACAEPARLYEGAPLSQRRRRRADMKRLPPLESQCAVQQVNQW